MSNTKQSIAVLRVCSRLIIALTLVVCTLQPAVAQRTEFRKHRDDQFGQGLRRSLMDVMRRLRNENPDFELNELVYSETARTEIGLPAEVFEQHLKQTREAFTGFRDLVEKYRAQQIDEDQFRQQLGETFAKPSALNNWLDQNSQGRVRLVQLYIQARECSALVNSKIAESVGMTSDELERFRKKRVELREKSESDFRAAVERMIRNPGPDVPGQIKSMLEEMQGEVNKRLQRCIKSEQYQKLQSLKGEAFEDLDRLRFGGGWRIGGGRGGFKPGSGEHRSGRGRGGDGSESMNSQQRRNHDQQRQDDEKCESPGQDARHERSGSPCFGPL